MACGYSGGQREDEDASYFLARTQSMKSRGLLFTVALSASFFNLHYLKFFSSVSQFSEYRSFTSLVKFIPRYF